MTEIRQLFGGAIQVEIPKRFIDVTTFRHIPDHQECFVDEKTDQSFIIELNEYQEHISNIDSIVHHYQVLVEDSGITNEKSVIINKRELAQSEMPSFDSSIPKYILLGEQKIAKFNEKGAENNVKIYLALIRLAKAKTDLLITFNETVSLSPASSSMAVVQTQTPSTDQSKSEQLFLSVLKSFKINDYSLFQNS